MMTSTPKKMTPHSRVLLILATVLLGLGSTVLPQHANAQEPTVYNQPGDHDVNGRQWRTSCEKYSTNVVRCTTNIWATTVVKHNGTYRNQNGWVFNNLTYLPSGESQWRGNPLAMKGKWTAKDGRRWRTECNTAQTGRGGCRSYAWSTSMTHQGGRFVKKSDWKFNNIVQFSTSSVRPQTTVPPAASTPPGQSTPPTPAPKPSTPATGASSLMGWELNKNNTGLAPLGLSCDSLPLYTGSLQPAAGTRITGKLIVGHLDLRAGDIIVERSCIRTGSGSAGQSMISNYVCGADDCPVISDKPIIIRDSEIDGSKAQPSQIAATCAFRGTATLQRNYMHGMGSGICFYGTGKKHDAIAEQNFVTNLRSYGESHNEAATIRDFELDQNPNRVARFTRNRLDIAEGNITAGLFIQPTWENIDTILVDGNLIEGGGYNLFLNKAHGTYTNARAINNRFVSTGWGPSTVQGGPGWTQWEDNYMYASANALAAGSVVRAN